MPLVTQPGWYLCKIIEWGARDAKDSKAVGIALKLATEARWDGDKWLGCEMAESFGSWFIIGKEAQFNHNAIDQLTRSGVWTGDFLRFDTPPPEDMRVVVQFTAEDYKGKTQVRPNWLYGPDHTPGAGNIANRAARERLLELNSMFGGQLRALATPREAASTSAAPAPAPAPPSPLDDPSCPF